ncbi:PQQ-dependent sugar dehydrogenase [Luteolibacter luteus]|uniref:Glucose/Sorbosone dehydrogenase domain-containing protein n=1 Tax=Luteolibacter luteus TaxID=2728835 RepID=A0A858RD44_9BACT|nr:PQQ-dependent sugar dehydrogenase [Luteolibacter luteus]QJE94524.1 hypothetical protein HHL09_01570 [Luteolibacter luteus]
MTNPQPSPLPSGLSVELQPWLTISPSSSSAPKARINHLKPCPDDSRLFCNDLRGKLWVAESKDSGSATEFLDLGGIFPNFIHTPGLGTGFASFAFHPEFRQAGKPGYGKLYTSHSETATGSAPDLIAPITPDLSQLGIVTEWTMSDPAANALGTRYTKREILRIGFPYNFHDIQEVEFDPTAQPGDENYGCLFICLGDGGSVVLDRPENIGRIDSPLGCIHRITPILASGQKAEDFTLSGNGKYYIPRSNPFAAAEDPTPGDGWAVVREIYAYGFRNPHRISWDRGGSGKMFCGNIGESMIEEVELVVKGGFYGWPAREGAYLFDVADKTHVYPLPDADASGASYPVTQYDHGEGRAAIAGGFVYRGTEIPALRGRYVCGDIVSGDLFAIDEAGMNPAAHTGTGDTPAPPKFLGVKANGVAAHFLTILGASRADLRLGQDNDGELYVLSKQNGKIYKVAPDAESGTTPPEGDEGTWQALGSFEDGTIGKVAPSVTGTSVQAVNDPVQGPVNRVLRLHSAGSTMVNAHVAIPNIPDKGRGTVYFRFFLPDQNHEHSWGLSEQADPNTSSHFKVEMRSTGSDAGQVEVRDAGSYVPGFEAEPGVWYSAWLHVNNAGGTGNDSFDLYVKGGSYGVPTLVKSGVGFRSGTSSALKTFFWRLAPGTEIYFDDLHVDPGHNNLSEPVATDWKLVDRFEGEAPLDSWDLPNRTAQASQILSEPSGNRFFRHAASSSSTANPKAVAAKRLPFLTQVSKTLTIFYRMRLQGTDLKQSFGASSTDPSNTALYTEDDFSPQLRIADGEMNLYDGPAGIEDFVVPTVDGAAAPLLEPDIWYNVWLVAYNGGVASGGQTWQAYIQGGAFTEQVQLGDTLHFRRQAELPLTHFLNIAANGGSFGNKAIDLDDIHAYEGANLADPLAPVWTETVLEKADGGVTLAHPTTYNRAFQMQESDDMKSWTPLGPVVEGDSSWRELTVPIVHPRRFFQAAELSRRDFHAAEWSTDFPGTTLPRGLSLLSSSSWQQTDGLLTLTTPAAQVSGMVARPGGYALLPGDWRNLTLTVESKSKRSSSTPQRDVVLIFGYVDEAHFYYALVNSASSGSAIVKVAGDSTTNIQSPATVAGKLTSNWQSLRVLHQATGAISVYCDNLSTPVMTATDTSYPVGRAGFGSYDDPADFRSVIAKGEQP